MSSLWWKMCFTKLIQIPWFKFRLSEKMFCSVSPDWTDWVARHVCIFLVQYYLYVVAIHLSMKCVKTIFTTDIVNIFYSYTLLLQMSKCVSQNIQWIIHNETIQKISIYTLKAKKISIFQHWSTVNTCVLGLHGQNIWTTSLNVMLSCMF